MRQAKKKRDDQAGAPGVIYARYSSHAQRDISIEQQVEQAKRLAAERGLCIIEIYADRAKTGKNEKRPHFQQMMKDAAAGRFRYVVAWKSNRIGRNMLEAMINEQRLLDFGVRVVYVEEDFDDSAAGRFAARSMMNVNQFYSDSMAEDIRRGLQDNASKCMVTNGHLPFGYKADSELHYAIDEGRAAVVREIYKRVAAGEAFVDIARDLNARGVKTSNKKEWGKSSFWTILHNERYRGIYVYNDVRIEGGVPRIIDDELFFYVQEVLKTKKNAQGRHRINGDYALTGKLFCGKCKSPMTGLSGRSKTGVLFYYYACAKKRLEHTCDKRNVRRDDIEMLVARAIREHILKDEIIDWIAEKMQAHNKKVEAESSVGLLEDQLAATQSGIKNIMNAIEAGIITETTKERLLELEAERADLEGKIAVAKADIIVLSRDQIVETLQQFRDGDIDNPRFRNHLFNTFLTAVYLYDDHLRIVFSFTGSKNAKDIPIDIDPPDDAEALGRVRISSPQLHQTRATRTPQLYEKSGVFVLLIPLPDPVGK